MGGTDDDREGGGVASAAPLADAADRPSAALLGVARAALSERAAELGRAARRTSRGDDVEAVHDLRVATRRAGEALAAFRPLLPSRPLRDLRRRLRRLRRALGPARNLEVLSARAAGLLGAVDDAEALLVEELVARLARRGARAGRALPHLVRALEPDELEGDVGRLVVALRAPRPAGASAGQEPRPFALAALRAACDRVRVAEATLAGGAPAPLHRLRVAVKKLRYQAECLAPLAPRQLPATLSALKERQELLGDLQDLRLLVELLGRRRRKLAARARPRQAEVVSRLVARVEAEQAERLRAFAEAHRRAPASGLTGPLEEELAHGG